MKISSCVTIADVGIEMSCDESLFRNTPTSSREPDFKSVDVCQPGDIVVNISSQSSPPQASKKVISGESNLWQLYVLEEGFLDCRFYFKNPHIPYWWSCVDRYYTKFDIGVNIQAFNSVSNGRNDDIRVDQFATDRKLMIPALINKGVLALHGAGGAVYDKGIVIAGTSGSGKSTMADLLVKAGHSMFSDECIVVRQHDGNNWLAYGTPWPSSAGIVRDASVPLTAILFLRQAKKTSWQRLLKTECLKRILQFSSIPWYLPHIADRGLSVCEHLLDAIPMFELQCSLDDQPVRVIEQLAESL